MTHEFIDRCRALIVSCLNDGEFDLDRDTLTRVKRTACMGELLFPSPAPALSGVTRILEAPPNTGVNDMAQATGTTYRFDRGSGPEGPVAADVLFSLAEAGRLPETTTVRTEPDGEWHTFRQHPDFRHAPERGSPKEDDGPKGLGGWLVLVGIGVVLSPVRMLGVINENLPAYQADVWAALTTPGSEAYHPLWGPLLVFEMAGNMILFLVGLALIGLYFARSRFFPKIYIAAALCSLVFVVSDAWLGGIVVAEPVGPDVAGEIGRSIGIVAIWVPYMLRSRRVRNTFRG